MRRGTALMLMSMVAGCAHQSATAPMDPWLRGIDSPERILAKMTVPTDRGGEREKYAADIVRAQHVVVGFALQQGWSNEASARLFDSVEVFADQKLLWWRILEVNQMPTTAGLPIPGLAAAIEGRVLLVLTPEEYSRVAPDYAALPDSWCRLVAHELVHRLHVEVLEGKEAEMGPLWFFEGFAVMASGQGFDDRLTFASADEALSAARDAKSPKPYRRYAAAVRFFTARARVTELIKHASSADFEAWLKALPAPAPLAKP